MAIDEEFKNAPVSLEVSDEKPDELCPVEDAIEVVLVIGTPVVLADDTGAVGLVPTRELGLPLLEAGGRV